MSADIQAQITANSSQAVAAIDQISAAMDRLKKKTNSANKESVDLQKKVRDDFKKTGEGVARAGGPMGSIGGRLLGGLGMGGAIGGASVALAALTLALNALSAASARAVDAVGKQAAAEDKIKAAQDAGEKAVVEQGKLGLAQASYLRPLIAQGGQPALKKLKSLETQGVESPDAAKGLQSVLVRYPNQPLDSGPAKILIYEATLLTKVGMKFSDAIEALVEKGGMGDYATAQHSAARVYRDFTGDMRGNPDEKFETALYNVKDDKLLNFEEGLRKKDSKKYENQRTKALGVGDALASELAAAMDPVSKAMLDLYNSNMRTQEVLDRQAAAESDLSRALATAARAWGMGPGSARQIADDNRIAVANAAISTPPAAPAPSAKALAKPDR